MLLTNVTSSATKKYILLCLFVWCMCVMCLKSVWGYISICVCVVYVLITVNDRCQTTTADIDAASVSCSGDLPSGKSLSYYIISRATTIHQKVMFLYNSQIIFECHDLNFGYGR